MAGVDRAAHDPGPAARGVRADPGHLVPLSARTLDDADAYGVGEPRPQGARHLVGDGELTRHQQMQHGLAAPGLREVHPPPLAFDALRCPGERQRHHRVGHQGAQPARQWLGGDEGEDRSLAIGGPVEGEQQRGAGVGVQRVGGQAPRAVSSRAARAASPAASCPGHRALPVTAWSTVPSPSTSPAQPSARWAAGAAAPAIRRSAPAGTSAVRRRPVPAHARVLRSPRGPSPKPECRVPARLCGLIPVAGHTVRIESPRPPPRP